MLKVALWKPNEVLLRNSNKLDPKQYKMQFAFSENEETLACMEEMKILPIAEVQKTDSYDYLLIDYNNAGGGAKKELVHNWNVPKEKIYTFEEFWVKDCESNLEKKYHGILEAMSEMDALRLYENKVVLITGGSSGIGKESAYAFAQLGANVIIVGRNRERLKDAVTDVSSTRGSIEYLEWDITDWVSREQKMEEAKAIFNKPINVLINCAGVWEGKEFFKVTEEDFDDIINTNLKAVYFLCQLFSNYFIKEHIKGHIVNVISNVGFLPTVKPYGLSKWGLVGLTKGLGTHLAEYGITVNGIAPGGVATPLGGWHEGDCPARRGARNGRISFPSEIAWQILQLAGDMGENMPGEILVCDGGDKTINTRL